jgi:hypothetical protein
MTKTAWILLCVAAFLLGASATLGVVNYVSQKRFEALCQSLDGTPATGANGVPSCLFRKNMV